MSPVPLAPRGYFSFIHALMESKMKGTESSAGRDRAVAGSDPVLTGLPPVRGHTESATREPLLPQHRTPGPMPRTRAP